MRNSRVVPSDDEITERMKAEGASGEAIAQELRERRDIRSWAQRAYDKDQPSSPFGAPQTHRPSAVPPPVEPEESEPQDPAAEMGPRMHVPSSGKAIAWQDMPLPYLQNAARKSGDPDMIAYADWRAKQG